MRRAVKVIAALVAVGIALAGCANDELAEQYRSGDSKGYISGSGVVELQQDSRGEPIVFAGTTGTDEQIDSAALVGNVLVVNFWYAQCPPCRLEAKDLESLHKKYEDSNVRFIGINTRDQAPAADAFDGEFGISYSSILDADGGQVQLAFSGSMRPNATPTTFVIDKEGRIAARIEGPISSQPSTLDTLVRDVLAED